MHRRRAPTACTTMKRCSIHTRTMVLHFAVSFTVHIHSLQYSGHLRPLHIRYPCIYAPFDRWEFNEKELKLLPFSPVSLKSIYGQFSEVKLLQWCNGCSVAVWPHIIWQRFEKLEIKVQCTILLRLNEPMLIKPSVLGWHLSEWNIHKRSLRKWKDSRKQVNIVQIILQISRSIKSFTWHTLN